MKPRLAFIGGCEFTYTIHELKTDADKYFDFECFHSFEEFAATDAYSFILENESYIAEQKPDAVVISQFDALERYVPRIQWNLVESKSQQDDQLAQIKSECEQMIEKLSPLSVPILLQYFPWPRSNVLNHFKPYPGIYNESQFLRKYITDMEELAGRYPNFYFMDLTDICSIYGYLKTFKNDAPWNPHIIESAVHIAEEFKRWISYVLRHDKKVKCVLVDLDDTMWNGVIRDVGVENIEIGIDCERFRWNVLRVLHARGILIGVVSKNDAHLEGEIREFIKPYLGTMKLVCMELSWEDKWEKVKEIQERLNIGLDSILFIDDNEFEREQMQAMLGEVRVADENIFESLLYLPEMQPEFVTSESGKRTEFYIEESQRKAAVGNLTREEFLKQCDFKIKVKAIESFEVDRVAELIQRTNQLNTSIKRYSKDEVIAFLKNDTCDIFVVYVADNFGDYGLVGVCIAVASEMVYAIDTLLFSCRIMSRGVEDYVLSNVLESARIRGFEKTIIGFKQGKKNAGMRRILEKNRFVESETKGSVVVYSFDLCEGQIKPVPEWFSLMESISEDVKIDAKVGIKI